jgi:RNA-directed DNA polymerase
LSDRRSLTDWEAEGFKPEADLPARVSLLRWRLGRKAKQEPKFRFYNLFGHVLRADVLAAASQRVRANKGGPGVDGVTYATIDAQPGGEAAWLQALTEDLRQHRYRPQPVKRVYIPKANGGQRPLGIPALRDRVAQMAVLLVIEPIFEADFLDCSYGFRPNRSAHQALDAVQGALQAGLQAVYDADLSQYFDTIDHERLMRRIERRLADGSVLRLIRLWLRCAIEEPDGRGGTRRARPTQGTPQGGVISPLLANIYLHDFDRAFHGPSGPAQQVAVRLVRYADDFLVLAREMTPRLRTWIEKTLEGPLRLTLNRDKTRVVQLGAAYVSLDFLGFTLRYLPDRFGRQCCYLAVGPSAAALGRIRGKVRMRTLSGYKGSLPALVALLNQLLSDWAPYYRYGYPRQAFRAVNHYVRQRCARFLRHRSQRRQRPFRDGESLYAGLQRYGLRYL